MYSANWITTNQGNGIKHGDPIKVSWPEAHTALYCVTYEAETHKIIQIYWDGFNDGAKDQICTTKTDILVPGTNYILVTKALFDNSSGYYTVYDGFIVV